VLSLTGHGTRKDIHRSRFQRIRHAVTLRTSLLDYIISYVMAAPGAKFAIIDCLVCVFIRMQIQRTGFISCNSDTTYLSARLCSLESTPGFSPGGTSSIGSIDSPLSSSFFQRFRSSNLKRYINVIIITIIITPLFHSRFKTFLFCKSFPQ